jgi:hypothetical protein
MFSKIQDGAHIQYGVFLWDLILEALAFVTINMQKNLHILEELIQKKK